MAKFQSTLPVRGGTIVPFSREFMRDIFQSTLPVRGGTQAAAQLPRITAISIHPPRAGRDSKNAHFPLHIFVTSVRL